MRLFLAVDLDSKTRRAVASLTAELSRALGKGGGRTRPVVAWVPPENLHLTLRFLGEVEEARADKLCTHLTPVWPLAPFEIVLSGVGVFPPQGPVRIVWVGVEAGAAQLCALQQSLEDGLEAWGFGRDVRPFHAHLTIARVKQPLGPVAAGILRAAPPVTLGTLRVDHLTLYRSHLAAGGPVYSVLVRTPLAGAAQNGWATS